MSRVTGPVVAVVQARMGSIRFPGKMAARLGSHRLIDWVLDRVHQATRVDAVVLATSAAPANDELASAATARGMHVVRGDEHDVLSRFITAADQTGAAWIVRVCADNPFIDGREIDRLVAFTVDGSARYTFNHLNRMDNGYADGFGAEMIRADALREVARDTHGASDREHVTAYVWKHPDRFAIATLPAPAALRRPELRFDIDTPEDLERLQRFASLGIDADAASFVAAAGG